MNAVFYGRIIFLSRAAPFDCGLPNLSCMSRSVKGGMLVWMVSESICHVRFSRRFALPTM